MNSNYLSTREAARSRGHKRYYTGKACVHGHVVWRLVSNGRCSECERAYQRTRGNELRRSTKYKEYQKRYQAAYRLTEHGKARKRAAQDKYRAKKNG